MSKTIEERIPRDVGRGALPDHPAAKTPWEKLISFHDAFHFAVKQNAFVDAVFMQAARILIPDYETRAEGMCSCARDMFAAVANGPVGRMNAEGQNVHPFMRGCFLGALSPDNGDEDLLMCGRVNDFGTHRVEKELDVCYWDIVGSEFCRTTVCGMEANTKGQSQVMGQTGPNLDYHMVEARGCGDPHCRIVAEDREKYPLPPHKVWETFGPIATSDQIKFTAREDMVTESQMFREECGYKFRNALCYEKTPAEAYSAASTALAATFIWPPVAKKIEAGEIDEKFADHVIRCVFEAAGKASFHDFYAVRGLQDWLGVPDDIHDGRALGAYIEVLCQVMRIDYTVETFCSEEVVYRISRAGLERRFPKLADAYLALWYGMCKTLVGAEWFLWEEAAGMPDEILRVKIAKKIDKFC